MLVSVNRSLEGLEVRLRALCGDSRLIVKGGGGSIRLTPVCGSCGSVCTVCTAGVRQHTLR